MCLKPLKIRNPTKNIAKCGGQLLQLQVPCGQCAECVTAKRNEWYIRSYYEVQNTLNKGGYILFDTLTYRDADIPKLSDYLDINKYGVKDFTCFSHRHFKLFLKRLRRRLEYKYFCNDFKYFLTSEYGEREGYTHRPHYHILFYVTCPVEPLEFSQLISECWQYGRTDGLPYQSVKYVSQHVYGRNLGYGSNTDFPALSSICMYVSKYITKSNKFRKKLLKRMDILKSKIEDDEELKELFRNIDMFHRQSQGFGLSYLSLMDSRQRELLKEDTISMPDKNKVVKTYPLPMYYKRKLYYTMKKRKDNRTSEIKRYWELTDNGFRHVYGRKLQLVDKQVVNYMDIINNTTEEYRNTFFKLLGNRDISEYVIYELFYKGRLRHNYSTDYYKGCVDYGLTDVECNLYDWLKVIRASSKNNTNYFGKCFLSDDDNIYLIKKWYQESLEMYDKQIFRALSFDQFVNMYCINENTCNEFKDFDKIGELFIVIQKQLKQVKQQTFIHTEDYKQRMKNFNLYLL